MDGWIMRLKGSHSCKLGICFSSLLLKEIDLSTLVIVLLISKFAVVLINATIVLSVMSFLAFYCLLNPLSIHASSRRVQLLVTQEIS
jgi:hypothetical protein